MSARPDLTAAFGAMERLVEAQPEGTTGEIVLGVLCMSPRPRGRHGAAQGRLFAALDAVVGSRSGRPSPDWLFIIEPELRHPRSFSRLVPDLAAWRRSTTGWPDLDETPITRMPEWVGEVLSPTTEADDRERKRTAYGQMGVGWLWIVDVDQLRIEAFTNVRAEMVAAGVFEGAGPVSIPPFEALSLSIRSLLP